MRQYVKGKANGSILFWMLVVVRVYYTKEIGAKFEHSYGIDLSKEAILHASKQDKHTQYIVGSLFDMPFLR